MPFSHHSHSGQFCHHATNTLEEMLLTAISRKMRVFALTEHMPRDLPEDLYPEEVAVGVTPESLFRTFKEYYTEAIRLREKYRGTIEVLVGFEGDWIRKEDGKGNSRVIIEGLLQKYEFDFFLGSIHHVHAVPIDLDHTLYAKAQSLSGGTEERLFEDYFDAQLDMLKALKPQVVGHFDLIRLKSVDPNGSFKRWNGVWKKIVRNLEFVATYGGMLELNSASLRKGMDEPYPKGEICETFVEKGGRFCFSDDSHAVEQVGLNYGKVVQFIEKFGIKEIYYLQSDEKGIGNTTVSVIAVSQLQNDAFYAT
ncbi:MAG: histidinolphosphatase [Cirrosporium novae-zelandiae]|nr:MAG: histidinolphosphatase [Cirrosporium novae-zelandiae]